MVIREEKVLVRVDINTYEYSNSILPGPSSTDGPKNIIYLMEMSGRFAFIA